MGSAAQRTSTSTPPRDQRWKLIAAALLLLISLAWIIYYFSDRAGPPKATPQDIAAAEAQHDNEMPQVKKDLDPSGRGNTPPQRPNGS